MLLLLQAAHIQKTSHFFPIGLHQELNFATGSFFFFCPESRRYVLATFENQVLFGHCCLLANPQTSSLLVTLYNYDMYGRRKNVNASKLWWPYSRVTGVSAICSKLPLSREKRGLSWKKCRYGQPRLQRNRGSKFADGGPHSIGPREDAKRLLLTPAKSARIPECVVPPGAPASYICCAGFRPPAATDNTFLGPSQLCQALSVVHYVAKSCGGAIRPKLGGVTAK